MTDEARFAAVAKAVHEAREKRGLPEVVFGIPEAAVFCAALDAALAFPLSTRERMAMRSGDAPLGDSSMPRVDERKPYFAVDKIRQETAEREASDLIHAVESAVSLLDPLGAEHVPDERTLNTVPLKSAPSIITQEQIYEAARSQPVDADPPREASQPVLADPTLLAEAADLARETWSSTTPFPWPAIVRAVLAFAAAKPREITPVMMDAAANAIADVAREIPVGQPAQNRFARAALEAAEAARRP
jgi:hypothetical protein